MSGFDTVNNENTESTGTFKKAKYFINFSVVDDDGTRLPITATIAIHAKDVNGMMLAENGAEFINACMEQGRLICSSVRSGESTRKQATITLK